MAIEYITKEYRGDLQEIDSSKFGKPRKDIVHAAQQRVGIRKEADYDEAQDNIDLYAKGDYRELVDNACHEGVTVERLHSVDLGTVYVCSTCSHWVIGPTVEGAIEQMAESMMFEIICGATGLC